MESTIGWLLHFRDHMCVNGIFRFVSRCVRVEIGAKLFKFSLKSQCAVDEVGFESGRMVLFFGNVQFYNTF